MNERIKQVRKFLKMSQTEFAAKMGVSQQLIASLEKPPRIVNERYIKMVCFAFAVNEQWFRHGTGSMFVSEPVLDAIQNKFSLSETERKFVAAYMELSEETRSAIMSLIKAAAEK